MKMQVIAVGSEFFMKNYPHLPFWGAKTVPNPHYCTLTAARGGVFLSRFSQLEALFYETNISTFQTPSRTQVRLPRP
jgi:hypothetical protein